MHSTTSTTVPARLAVPTASLSGLVVSQLSASAASSTALRLSWQLQQQQQQHRQVVEGFRVRYRSLDNAAANDAVDYLEKTVRPGDVTQFLLTGESRTCHSTCYFRTRSKCKSKVMSFPSQMGPWGALISVSCSPQPDRHQLTLRGHEYAASVSRGVSVYSPAFAGTKLYCLVTEAHRCEKLAQSFYAVVPGPDSNPRLLVASPTLYLDATTPPSRSVHPCKL